MAQDRFGLSQPCLPRGGPAPLDPAPDIADTRRSLAAGAAARDAKDHQRSGYRRAHALLVREGWVINRKKVLRIWREEGLKVRPDTANAGVHPEESRTTGPSAPTYGPSTSSSTPPPMGAWSRSPTSSTSSPRDWCRSSGTETSYFEPGSPWENPFVESYNVRMRDELLALTEFCTLTEAHVLIEDWRIGYNKERPHSSLDYLTPLEFHRGWIEQHHPEPALS
jgi:putative transposase